MSDENTEKKKIADSRKRAGYRDSEFIPLDDLVYAPLRALAKSNQQLCTHVIETIKSMGTARQQGREEIIHLKSMNIAYDQIRPESEDGYSVDNLQLQIPLLSVVPVSSLNVEKAEIAFSAEICADEQEGDCKINARICSQEQRESDFFPRVSYKMHIRSLAATEGILRLTDLLSTNQVAKQLDTTPVNVNGGLGNDDQKNIRQKVSTLKNKIKKLKQLYQRVLEMMAEQEKMRQVSKSAFEENVYDFDRNKYLMVQSNIANRIMKYQEQIMDLEIEYGLEMDYE